FERFINQLPTIQSLAEADEQTVLRLWQGLGYYSRARNLQKAAQKIVREFADSFPQDLDDLQKLPGVGRYTAGAIASIAFNRRAPIVDGNVARVICRLDAIKDDPKSREVNSRLWTRADELVPKLNPGEFNSAMMELGALICTPRNPSCVVCPVREACEARALGIEKLIPIRKVRKANPIEKRIVHVIERGGKFLFEQRPMTGRWAGMWQFITRESKDDLFKPIKKLGELKHQLTHRSYEFEVWRSKLKGEVAGRWVTIEESESIALPKPHVTIRSWLSEAAQAASAKTK
ncbi:MAG TPA: A/G-specific adenine glycosylase, partial [Tepidisphaeraceae bacterium]|nr:A/G-specific adenine glycosylase [Tepidisphaeraceae bacterium]